MQNLFLFSFYSDCITPCHTGNQGKNAENRYFAGKANELVYYFTYTLGGLARIRATISFLLVDASSEAS